jgi:hypothetical protein
VPSTVVPVYTPNNVFPPIVGNVPGSGGSGIGGGASAGSGGVGGASGGVSSSGGVNTGVGASISAFLVDRKIERSATIDIVVEDVPGTVSKIEAAATAAGGIVSQETVAKTAGTSEKDEADHHTAMIQIRVPAESFSAVMDQLRGLADEVVSENTVTNEVTGQYTDLQSQLRNLQATEQQYLALLDQAANVNDVLTVQDRLNSVRGQIEQVQGQIALIDSLTALATITVNIAPPTPVPTASPTPSPSPTPVPTPAPPSSPNWASGAWSDSWNASVDVLEFIGVAAITAGVVAVWLVAISVIAFVAWKLFVGRGKPAEPAP